MTTRELLAAVKAAQSIPSNYALARILGVPENTVANWHTGRNLPNDEWAAKLAVMANMDAGHVVACVHAERAQSDDARELWTKIAERLRAAAAVALTAIVSVWITLVPAGDAQAMARGAGQVAGCELGAALSIHCRQLLAALARLLRRIAQRRHPLMGAHATA